MKAGKKIYFALSLSISMIPLLVATAAAETMGVQRIYSLSNDVNFGPIDISSGDPEGTVLATLNTYMLKAFFSSGGGYNNRRLYFILPEYQDVIPWVAGIGVKVSFGGDRDSSGQNAKNWSAGNPVTPNVQIQLVRTTGDISVGEKSAVVNVPIGWKVYDGDYPCNGPASWHPIGQFTQSEGCSKQFTDGTTNYPITIKATIRKVVGNCTFTHPSTVTLPQMVTSALTASGGEGGERPFTIGFTGCQGYIERVQLSLSPGAGATIESENILKGNDATNVGIQVLHEHSPITFSSSAAMKCGTGANCIPLRSGNVTNFDQAMSVRYKKLSGVEPQPGSISIPVVFTVHYE